MTLGLDRVRLIMLELDEADLTGNRFRSGEPSCKRVTVLDDLVLPYTRQPQEKTSFFRVAKSPFFPRALPCIVRLQQKSWRSNGSDRLRDRELPAHERTR